MNVSFPFGWCFSPCQKSKDSAFFCWLLCLFLYQYHTTLIVAQKTLLVNVHCNELFGLVQGLWLPIHHQ